MPISAKARQEILKKLLFTPERKKLLNKEIRDLIEEVVTHPDVKRAYVAGSFASKKPDPGDIDLLVRHRGSHLLPEGEDFTRRFRRYIADPFVGGARQDDAFMIMETWPKRTIYPMTPEGRKMAELSIPSMAKMKPEMAEARKRYGKDYKWIRIASILAALEAAGELKKEKDKNKDKEKDKED